MADILVRVHRSRLLIAACCLALVAACLGAPAIALAGGSAGDQQYTDPFSGGSAGGGATTTPAQTQTATAPAQTAPAPAAPTQTPDTTPAETAPAATAPAETTPADSSTYADPTATVAGPSAGTLPYTGYPAWTAAGLGAVLLGAGLTLRLRTRAVD